MNPVVKAQLKEFQKNNSDEDLSESDFFEVMSIFAVENGILTENIDPFAAHLRGTEFGVDGIAIIIQGELCTNTDEVADMLAVGKNHSVGFHFFQSKTSESVDYGDMSKFLDGVYDFFNGGKLLESAQVSDLISAKDMVYSAASKENPKLRCFYCTTGANDIPSPISKLIESNQARLEALSLFSSVEIHLLGAKDIQNAYRAATNAITSTIEFPKAVTLPDHPAVEEAFVGFIAADQIIKIATTEIDGEISINRSVFYDNVRDFNPGSEINKSILKELEDGDVESFVFKNNGVTVVAREINRKSDTFTLDDYQIVNGCQTTNILFLAGANANNVSVPFRLIGSKDPEFISSIIVGTNKQNEVKDDQFWALMPFMKNLEEYCRAQDGEAQIFIERRENQYRDLPIERTRIFRPADLMKAVAAMYLFQPNRAARDYRGIRKEFSGKIFEANHSVELYHLAALAAYKFDFAIRNGKVDRSRGIYKFYALYGLVRKLWNNSDVLDTSKKSQQKLISAIRAILDDNDQFVRHIEEVSIELDKIITNSGASTREQMRDYIRTETVAEQFTKQYIASQM